MYQKVVPVQQNVVVVRQNIVHDVPVQQNIGTVHQNPRLPGEASSNACVDSLSITDLV